LKKKKGFIFKNVAKGTKYPLIDVEAPELFRDIFPYTEMCKVKFDHKIELIDPPDDIYITDTTFRDGQQSRPPFTAKQRTSSTSCTGSEARTASSGRASFSSIRRRTKTPSGGVLKKDTATRRSQAG